MRALWLIVLQLASGFDLSDLTAFTIAIRCPPLAATLGANQEVNQLRSKHY